MRWDGSRVMGGAAAALGAVTVVLAGGLAEGTTTGGPGTRFLPSLLGGLMVLLGGIVALGRAGPPAEPVPAPAQPATAPSPAEARGRVLTTVAVIVGYALVLDRLGFLLATVALVGILVRLYGERRWPVVAGVAVGAAVATYGLFATWLKVPLPPGLLAP